MKRIIVQSIAGGTATATITVPASGTLRSVDMSIVPAAAGSWELSTSSTSQIATAAPDSGVIARARVGVSLGSGFQHFEPNRPVKVLDYLYLHCTGAGNVGELTLRID